MDIMDVVKKYHSEIDYGAHRNCATKHPGASNCIECCQKPYFDQIEIDYSCPQKRKLYVVRYAPAYSKEIYKALSLTPRDHRNTIFQKPELNIVSIGGGPGTDIAAFNKWISTRVDEDDEIRSINFIRLDIESGWRGIAKDLIHLHELEHIDYNYSYQTLDISDNAPNLSPTYKADIILVSYLISELQDNDVVSFADNIREIISEDTLVIINDRPQPEVISNIELFLEEIGCKKDDIIQSDEKEHCGVFYPDEIFEAAAVTIYCKSIRYNAAAIK